MENNSAIQFQKKRLYISVLATCLFAWLSTYLSVSVFKDYVFGLFVWLPIVMGIVSTVIYGYKNPDALDDLSDAAKITLAVFCFGLFFFAMEGIICLIMAAPIGLVFTWIGYKIGKMMLQEGVFGSPPLMTLVFALSVPVLMAFEDKYPSAENLNTIVTIVEIKASPETVWKNVAEFPELPPPTEWIFKTGIAYPINAKITGQGVGAIRNCNFSTGSFIEPITTWDAPNLLQFDVVEQPEPMKELSPYDIEPNHLHGYWVSKKGQFKLTRLANGNTQLEGTTWYYNKIQPNLYWSLWSDFIVHKIHERVLNHIKNVSETKEF